jgi:alpha-glucosidase
LLSLLLALPGARAQDERRVVSPNGQIEFRLFLAQPDQEPLFHLAYQVLVHGKPLLDTSFLGLDVLNQEPLLGENVGLTSAAVKADAARHYNSMTAEYMQNGSLGRRLNVEARAYDDGVAFRYVIPRSTPLDEILIKDELTEFAFTSGGVILEEHSRDIAIPFAVKLPDTGWAVIAEAGRGDFPPMHLTRSTGTVLMSHLARQTNDPNVAFEAATPVTLPWRAVIIGFDRDHIAESMILGDLNH